MTTRTLSSSLSASSILSKAANGTVSSSIVLEWISLRSSSSVFVYDLAEQIGFGACSKAWSTTSYESAPVSLLQTRSGAGLGIVGCLSEVLAANGVGKSVVTAYTTLDGLNAMAQSLSHLPTPTHCTSLIFQVASVSPVGPTFTLSPTLSSVASIISTLPSTFAVLLSGTPQESIDLAALTYSLANTYVVHIFDHHSSSRELGHFLTIPDLWTRSQFKRSVHDAFHHAGYHFFDLSGDENARSVVVLLNGPLAQVVKVLAVHIPGLAVITVRVLKPWDGAAIRNTFPSTTSHIHVLDEVPAETAEGALYTDVLASVFDSSLSGLSVHAHRVTPSTLHQYLSTRSSINRFLLSLVPNTATDIWAVLQLPTLKRVLFFGCPNDYLSPLPRALSRALARVDVGTRFLSDHDVVSKPGGLTSCRLLLYPKHDSSAVISTHLLLPIPCHGPGHTDLLAVLDYTLLKSHSILTHSAPNSLVLVFAPGSASEFSTSLLPLALNVMRERNLRVFIMDVKALASELHLSPAMPEDSGDLQVVLGQLAFLRLYLGESASENIVFKLARAVMGDAVAGVDVLKICRHAWSALQEIQMPAGDYVSNGISGKSTPDENKASLKQFEFNAISCEGTDEGDVGICAGARMGLWHDAAKALIFPSIIVPSPVFHPASSDEYPSNSSSMRPETTDRTYLVTCTVNRRLTPLEYDRNVFHLEFDTARTGLRYAIGEALGVHGWNDTAEVLNFCRWYGVDPERLITIPVTPGSGVSSAGNFHMHTRTVFQTLQQQIDVFGRPGKSFYADLAGYTVEKTDKLALQFIGSPEGSSTFKKLSEKDTITYADVLKRYASARPGIETLCKMIGDIKPRHYSIASAQSVVGDRVDLLVVTVEWVTPSGSPRYGQCTRYLANLKIGQKVTVSIKPSVMKLPPDNMQPMILAGLGTGAAPFRAFLQHRAWLAHQNIPFGPLYYYFGSRHRAQEYLYGEEIEAFILDRTITKAGLAFSRDSREKVYIQHLMQADADVLVRMLYEDRGVFYLCGPTWPVPDVYETLVGALVKHIGKGTEEAAHYLESLKEEERYVLEVY